MSWLKLVEQVGEKVDPDDDGSDAAAATLLVFTTGGAGVVRGPMPTRIPETA